MLSVMRCLKIKRLDLEDAFESGFAETHYYLDTQTREALMVENDCLQSAASRQPSTNPEDQQHG
jgi:hypothetical protein